MKEVKNIINVWNQFMIILSPSQKRWAIVIFVMSLIGAIVETLGVSAILPLVQAMVEPEMILKNEIVSRLFSTLGIEDERYAFLLVALGVIVIYLIKNLYLCVLSYARVKYSTKVQRELSLKMLYSYMQRGYTFFRLNNVSTLLRGMNGSIVGVFHVLNNLTRTCAELLTILCIFIYVVYTDWRMAICMIILLGACLMLILYFFKGIMKKSGEEYFDQMALASKWSLQLFSGIKEVLVLRRNDFFVENYANAYTNQQNAQVKQTVATEIPAYIIEGACVTGIVTALCIRVGNIENPAAYIPQLAVFAMAAFRLLPSIGRISAYFNGCIFNLPSVTEVYENILEANNAEIYNVNCSEEEREICFTKALEVKDIVWKYPDGTENILDHISLSIKKGEAIAFVGPSGAGKSTLADIILGLFQPQEGSILIDGISITNNKKAISRLVGFVPQTVYLIDDTIRRNIAFGMFDNEIDDTAIWRALEQTQMKKFVESLPLGLDTVVGERGVRFSGGQSQRLAIARALYTNPDILILDEATSALDTETETAVMEAIEALQGQKTLIIIAHRLTTIKNCDKIYEILGGKVREKKYSDLI